MREILFKGKKVDNGKWVYGYYVKHETRQTCPMGNDKLSQDEIKHLIVVDSFADWNMPKTLQGIEVIPETVGQFTGLKDKNGVKIFEGDIVRFVGRSCLVSFVQNDCAFRIEVDNKGSTALRKAHSNDLQVIGNIHGQED